jgi:hypothetical protein
MKLSSIEHYFNASMILAHLMKKFEITTSLIAVLWISDVFISDPGSKFRSEKFFIPDLRFWISDHGTYVL